ncbi:hypothetical protein [Accumulibacter sp.]|uniref:FitA-like ribbon-helix-helix domain-containing protein n=1 Tax=Accumulibacter sp. TaxID=2053492 RepID=UPI0025CDB4A8|nr:hypothetical protein [Accumulibacter sp.]MCM8613154.1 hypothetical protein [Accumulibacter sp.]MCM8636559.1 hypothetical protein [Accumulibacter sp.]MCM8640207.1 hypothetical protein [Accumulibacter sp.]
MPSLQIRNLPEDLYEALAFRAEQSHRSLAQEALIALRRATESTVSGRRQQILEEISLDIATAGIRALSVPPERMLREDRDR